MRGLCIILGVCYREKRLRNELVELDTVGIDRDWIRCSG